MKKKLILVGAPPACGKNYVSDLICKSIKNVAYFDKDDLTDLRLCAFEVSGQVADTDGEFYIKNIRPFEYSTLFNLAFTALKYESIYYDQKREQVRNDRQQGEAKRNRVDLITELDNSHSYATTHAVIAKLQSILDWENEEREDLFRIGMENSQVLGVLNDTDVKVFYKKLIGESKALSDNAKKIKAIIEE